MKKISVAYLFVLVLFVLSGCTSIKNIPYLQNADVVDLSKSKVLHDARIMPKDELTIYINTTDPKASAPFNLYSSNGQNGGGGGNQMLGYLVNNDGEIHFPILGKLKVAGLTKEECQDMIAEKLKTYLAETEDPIVTVKMSSFHITVLGEVGGGVIPVTTEKMNIFEAIASAGDLTIYGHRENIMLIREHPEGGRSVHRLNINDANIINSPYYYVQQNDIIYVEPQAIKARNAFVSANTSLWFTLVGVVTSIATLVTLIIKK